MTVPDILRKNFRFILLFIIVLATKIHISEDSFTTATYDSCNYQLAMDHYSLTDDRPHLPGYYLYVKICALLSFYTHHHQVSLVLFSAIFSCLSVMLLYVLARKWFSQKDAFLASLVLAFNPMVWYYGAVSENYSFDLFFSIVTLILGLSRSGIYLLPLLFGLAAGIRFTSPVILFPLYLILWILAIAEKRCTLRKTAVSHMIGLLAFGAWFIPMISTVGGWTSYLTLYTSKYPAPPYSLYKNVILFSMYSVYIAPFFLFTVLGLALRPNIWFIKIRRRLLPIGINAFIRLKIFWILAAALVPCFAVFIFFHYNKGYLLLCMAPLLLVTLFCAGTYRTLFSNILILAQLLFFFYAPYERSSMESAFRPEIRTISQGQVLKERFMHSTLLSRSKIQFNKKEFSLVHSFITEQIQRLKDPELRFFFDPSSDFVVRNLQIRFPEAEFVTLDLVARNRILSYHDTTVTRMNITEPDFLKNYLIITTDAYFKKYLSHSCTVRFAKEYWILCTIKPGNEAEILETYWKLFGR